MRKQLMETNQFLGYVHRPYCPDNAWYDMENLCAEDWPLVSTKRFQRVDVVNDIIAASFRKTLEIDGSPKDCLVLIGMSQVNPNVYGVDILYAGGKKYQEIDVGFDVWMGRKLSTREPTEKFGGSWQTAVNMGNNVILWPAKLILHWTGNKFEVTDMMASVLCNAVEFIPCDREGNEYNGTASETEPTEMTEGSIWFDISGSTVVVKKYTSFGWESVPGVYTKIKGFVGQDLLIPAGGERKIEKIAAGDITTNQFYYQGTLLQSSNIANYIESGESGEAAVNALKSLYREHELIKRGDNYLVYTGIVPGKIKMNSGIAMIAYRFIPPMDYIVECNNRLWGCYYGYPVTDYMIYEDARETGEKWQNGELEYVNEIYCTKLGDPKSWRNYSGISTAAWAASSGTDGPWTGATVFNGSPIFFKRHSMTKVYISSIGAHQTVDYEIDGPASNYTGILNNVLYYAGRNGIYAYDGSQPAKISDAIGNIPFYECKIATSDRRLYAFVTSEEDFRREAPDFWSNNFALEYDPSSRTWWRLSGNIWSEWLGGEKYPALILDVVNSTKWYGGLFISYHEGQLCFIEPPDIKWPTTSWIRSDLGGPVFWQAISGIQFYTTPDRKYIGRYSFRLELEEGSTFELEIEYDSSGEWIHCGSITGDRHGCYTLPVVPRRCDHLRYRIYGTGPMKLFAITREFEGGTDK